MPGKKTDLNSIAINEVQLVLAEKRTSLSVKRHHDHLIQKIKSAHSIIAEFID